MLRKILWVRLDDKWQMVFCHNPVTGIVTTERRNAALRERDLDWFQSHYDLEFKAE